MIWKPWSQFGSRTSNKVFAVTWRPRKEGPRAFGRRKKATHWKLLALRRELLWL
jgi:hypothetical protein